MAKEKNSAKSAGRGKSSHSESGAVKLGKSAQDFGNLSRTDFIKMAGISAAATAAGATALGNVAKAQTPPPPCTPYMTPGSETVFTLAAFIDTILPGVEGYPINIQVLDTETGDLVTLGTMCNLGAPGTEKPGSAACPNSYNYFSVLAPILSHERYILQALEQTLDSFVEPYKDIPVPQPPPEDPVFYSTFKELPYDDIPTEIPDPQNPGQYIVIPGRYTILYLMDKPDLLVPILKAKGYPLGDALQQAANAKKLFTFSLYLAYTIALSEVCNLFPSGQDPVTKLPYYERNDDNTWNVIEWSMWHQMGYPGSSYKEPSYATEYDGLRVTIADGKVKFEK